MSFHLTFAQALAENWAIWITGALGILTLVLAAVVWRRTVRPVSDEPAKSASSLQSSARRPNVGPLLAVIGVFLLALGAWFAYSGTGSGWSLSNGTLSVKTGFGNADIPVAQASAKWVSPSGPYGLALRTNGVSVGQLQAGHFKTNSGQAVLVFHYGSGHRWLLVRDGATQVLISSPHVATLASSVLNARVMKTGVYQSPQTPSYAIYVRLVIGLAVGLIFFAAHLRMAKRAAPRLPDQLTTHWGFDGKADGWMKKQTVLRLMPTIGGILALIGVAVSLVAYVALAIFAFAQLIVLVTAAYMYRANENH